MKRDLLLLKGLDNSVSWHPLSLVRLSFNRSPFTNQDLVNILDNCPTGRESGKGRVEDLDDRGGSGGE